MRNHQRQSGMAIIEVVLIAVIVGLVGVAGYKVYDTRKTVDTQLNQSNSQAPSKSIDVSEVPAVKSSTDLNKAEQALNSVNPDDSASDEAQLESQMAAF